MYPRPPLSVSMVLNHFCEGAIMKRQRDSRDLQREGQDPYWPTSWIYFPTGFLLTIVVVQPEPGPEPHTAARTLLSDGMGREENWKGKSEKTPGLRSGQFNK